MRGNDERITFLREAEFIDRQQALFRHMQNNLARLLFIIDSNLKIAVLAADRQAVVNKAATSDNLPVQLAQQCFCLFIRTSESNHCRQHKAGPMQQQERIGENITACNPDRAAFPGAR